jgi:hypothetical protein
MKRAFAAPPIRSKIIVLASLSSAMALILAGTAIAFTDYASGKRSLMHRLQTQAQITATHSAAAVAFDDADAAAHALEALRSDRAIMAAEIRRNDGTQLAKQEFLRELGKVHLDDLRESHTEKDGDVHVVAPVVLARGSLDEASELLTALRSAFAVMEPELIAVMGVEGRTPAA